MKSNDMDKSYRTEFYRIFLIDALPEPLTRASSHLQIFDNYLPNTRLRLRAMRSPETKDWTHILQQRFSVPQAEAGTWKTADIYLNEAEYAHLRIFEGNEIRKNRYFHEFDGRTYAFDVYLGPLWGLQTARVEFATREEMMAMEPPAFAILEITGDLFFGGGSLVNKSFADIQKEVNSLGAALGHPPDDE